VRKSNIACLWIGKQLFFSIVVTGLGLPWHGHTDYADVNALNASGRPPKGNELQGGISGCTETAREVLSRSGTPGPPILPSMLPPEEIAVK